MAAVGVDIDKLLIYARRPSAARTGGGCASRAKQYALTRNAPMEKGHASNRFLPSFFEPQLAAFGVAGGWRCSSPRARQWQKPHGVSE